MEKDPHAEGIKKSIEDIIGADTSLRRKKKTDEDFHKEKFTKLIQTLDEKLNEFDSFHYFEI